MRLSSARPPHTKQTATETEAEAEAETEAETRDQRPEAETGDRRSEAEAIQATGGEEMRPQALNPN